MNQDLIGKTFDVCCSEARAEIKKVGEVLKQLIDKAKTSPEPEVVGMDRGEMIANATLAYRHAEDAAMRVGKAIQAYEGGKSIYDNNDAARVASNGPVGAGEYATS